MHCKKKIFSKTSKDSYLTSFFVEFTVLLCYYIAMFFCSFIFLAEPFPSQCNILYYSYKIKPLFSGRDSDASQREALQLVEIPAHRCRIQPDCNSSEAPSCLGILGISINARGLDGRHLWLLMFGGVFLAFAVFLLFH